VVDLLLVGARPRTTQLTRSRPPCAPGPRSARSLPLVDALDLPDVGLNAGGLERGDRFDIRPGAFGVVAVGVAADRFQRAARPDEQLEEELAVPGVSQSERSLSRAGLTFVLPASPAGCSGQHW